MSTRSVETISDKQCQQLNEVRQKASIIVLFFYLFSHQCGTFSKSLRNAEKGDSMHTGFHTDTIAQI